MEQIRTKTNHAGRIGIQQQPQQQQLSRGKKCPTAHRFIIEEAQITKNSTDESKQLLAASRMLPPLPLATMMTTTTMNLKLSIVLPAVVLIMLSLATLCASNAPKVMPPPPPPTRPYSQVQQRGQHDKVQELDYMLQERALASPNLHSVSLSSRPARSPLAESITINNTNHDNNTIRRRQAHFVEPEGDSSSQRIAVGRSVRFKCVVLDIGDHVVAWFHKDRRILLAIDNKTIAWRDRIQVSSQANSVFFLQIDSVQLNDKGHYVCQLNTQPMQSQTHILDVVKSPQIKEQETTINIEPVKEFSSVELKCVAEGIPKPVIKWRRESQMFELPVLADSEQDSELDSGDDKPFEGDEKLGDNVKQQAADDSDERTQVASRSSLGRRVARNNSSPLNNDSMSPYGDDLHDKGSTTTVKRQLETQSSETKDGVLSSLDLASSLPHKTRQLSTHSGANFEGQKGSPLETSRHGQEMGQRRRRRSTVRAALASPQSSMPPSPTANSSLASSTANVVSVASQNFSSFSVGANSKPFIGEGEILRIERVTRYDMGYYMCIASNGVPPSVSQRIFLPVSSESSQAELSEAQQCFSHCKRMPTPMSHDEDRRIS